MEGLETGSWFDESLSLETDLSLDYQFLEGVDIPLDGLASVKHEAAVEIADKQESRSSFSSTSSQFQTSGKHKRKQLKSNRESARESRARKLQRIKESELKLQQLETQNIALRLQLRIGKEAIARERQEKRKYVDQMTTLLQTEAPDHEIEKCVNAYKQLYSDYGQHTQGLVQYHLSCIRTLSQPTDVTKMGLYAVASAEDSTEKAASTDSLADILINELEITETQKESLLARRSEVEQCLEHVRQTADLVEQLEHTTTNKNITLSYEIDQMQQIFTPKQSAKFIIWVKENPAFMYMLSKVLEKSILMRPKSAP